MFRGFKFPKNLYNDEDLETFKNVKVVILTPTYRSHRQFWESVIDMMGFSWNYGLRVETIETIEGSMVHLQREMLAEKALDAVSCFDGEPFTHFLCIDDDHTFAPDLACNLIRKMKINKASILSAICYRKNTAMPPIFIESTTEKGKYHQLIRYPKNVFRVGAVGFGVIMIESNVFKKVPKPWFVWNEFGSEDTNFCRSAEECGFNIYVDGNCVTGHISYNMIIDENNYIEALENMNEELIPMNVD